MPLTPEHLAQFKKILENSKKEIEARLQEFKAVPEMGTDVDHFDEEADEAEEFSTNAGIEKVYKERLENIKLALDKMHRPKKDCQYGICENCHKEITLELLNIDPETRFCKNCKTK
jgi:RNA polymerase-binding transcription factor DksA